MKIIKLTQWGNDVIYLNADKIISLQPVPPEMFAKTNDKPKTWVYVKGISHSYTIMESAEQIIKIISEAKNI